MNSRGPLGEQQLTLASLSAEQKSNAASSSSSSDFDSTHASSSTGFRSPEAAGPLMLAQVEPCSVNFEHYRALPDLDVELRLSSAHILEIEALGRILAETMGEAAWSGPGPTQHLPAALSEGDVTWPTLLRYVHVVTCRLDAFLSRYSDLSSWNLYSHLLPAIKVRETAASFVFLTSG